MLLAAAEALASLVTDGALLRLSTVMALQTCAQLYACAMMPTHNNSFRLWN